jgi:hypothetical protein
VGEIRIAEKPGALGPQLYGLGNDGLVVGCAAVVATRDEGAVDFLA